MGGATPGCHTCCPQSPEASWLGSRKFLNRKKATPEGLNPPGLVRTGPQGRDPQSPGDETGVPTFCRSLRQGCKRREVSPPPAKVFTTFTTFRVDSDKRRREKRNGRVGLLPTREVKGGGRRWREVKGGGGINKLLRPRRSCAVTVFESC